MQKKLFAIILAVMLVLSGIHVMAAEEPVIFKDTITVTEDGGRYQVGFANIEFKKGFLEADKFPVTFEVVISAKDGVAGIDFEPDTPAFIKQVHIRVESYKGMLYDESSGTNVQVDVKKQQIKAKHFSRYAFS